MGIWLIYYGVTSEHREEYLHWFEGQHIEEKLARPGYDWACHYEVTPQGVPDTADHAYLALFGADSTRVFFDPSPAQIKPNQDELTRTMISYRLTPLATIVTQEWCEYSASPDSQQTTPDVVNSEYIRLGIFEHTVDDQTVVAWCAQDHFPKLASSEELVVARKCLASFGKNRHMVLEEYASAIKSTGSWQELPNDNLLKEPLTAKLRVFRRSS